MQSVEERFWSKVASAEADECWLWAASVKASGYGQFRYRGTTGYAHRFAYEFLICEIPEGLELDHLCRVHRCVNPWHLEPVSHAENMRRGYFGAKTHCPSGHPYDEQNTRWSKGNRHCRTCQYAWNRRGVA